MSVPKKKIETLLLEAVTHQKNGVDNSRQGSKFDLIPIHMCPLQSLYIRKSFVRMKQKIRVKTNNRGSVKIYKYIFLVKV